MRYLLIAACLALLSACGSEKGNDTTLGSALGDQAKALIAARAAKKAPPVAPEPLRRDQFSHIKRKVVLVTVARRGLKQSLSTRVADNQGFVTYLNKFGQAVTLKNGMLAATRGFGEDLLIADLGQAPKRVYKYLDPENHQTRLTLTCETVSQSPETITIVERRYATIKTEEVCQNSWKAVKNRFWRDPKSGKVWKSEQWAGLQLGFVIIEALN